MKSELVIQSGDIFEDKYRCKKFRTDGIIKTAEQERMAEEVGKVLKNKLAGNGQNQIKLEAPKMKSVVKKKSFWIKFKKAYKQTTIEPSTSSSTSASPISATSPVSSAPVYEPSTKINVPKINDDVISHWSQWQFFKSNIVSFDIPSMSYTVKWKDGDTTGTIQKYDLVALDKTPEISDIGVGSKILFEQGNYALNGEPGYRWHLGIVEIIEKKDGVSLFSGRHLKGKEDGKWCTYKGYSLTFTGYGVEKLRTFPNAMDAIGEFQKLG